MISYPLTLPNSPAPKEQTIEAVNNVAEVVSPFTASSQVQSWAAEYWKLSMVYPPLERDGIADLASALVALRGKAGTFYAGPGVGKVPRGSFAGTPRVNGVSQVGSILLADGFTANTANVIRKFDWFQLGAGYQATRIQTSGGSDVVKYYVDPGMSVSGQRYVVHVRVKNLGSSTMLVGTNFGGVQDSIAAGVEKYVVLKPTGDGVADVQIQFVALVPGDALDVVAWDPVIRRFGVEENLVPIAKRNFSSWSAYSGATVTLTQGINRRLYQAQEDIAADAGGNAEIPIFPVLRESPIDNDLIISTNPTGVFRLADNSRKFDINLARRFGVTIQAREAF
jgi:hypothetical protein